MYWRGGGRNNRGCGLICTDCVTVSIGLLLITRIHIILLSVPVCLHCNPLKAGFTLCVENGSDHYQAT